MTLDDIWNYTGYMGLYMGNIPYYGIYPMIYGMQYGLDNWEITNDSTTEIDGWNSNGFFQNWQIQTTFAVKPA